MRAALGAALSLALSVGCGREDPRPAPVDAATPAAAAPGPARADHPVVVVALSGASVPDAQVDSRDRIHVASLTNAGDVVYRRYRPDGEAETDAVRVNDAAGTATGGAFRGPDLALGEDGRAHVVWYPDRETEPGQPLPTPGIHYAHADPDSSFTAARSLNRRPSDDFSLAADAHGRVQVMWIADQLFVQRSEDAGETWSDPEVASMDVLPCECCGTRLHLDAEGGFYGLYRDRADDIRDIYLLVQPGAGAPTRHRLATKPWPADVCPMSGNSLVPTEDGLAAAWRTRERIEFARLDPAGQPRGRVRQVEDEGAGKRYPLIVVAPDGTLLVGYKRGTTLQWRLYDPDGNPRPEHGVRETENPSRGAGAAVTDGTFVLFG